MESVRKFNLFKFNARGTGRRWRHAIGDKNQIIPGQRTTCVPLGIETAAFRYHSMVFRYSRKSGSRRQCPKSARKRRRSSPCTYVRRGDYSHVYIHTRADRTCTLGTRVQAGIENIAVRATFPVAGNFSVSRRIVHGSSLNLYSALLFFKSRELFFDHAGKMS